jgi:hypothetical protein
MISLEPCGNFSLASDRGFVSGPHASDVTLAVDGPEICQRAYTAESAEAVPPPTRVVFGKQNSHQPVRARSLMERQAVEEADLVRVLSGS